MGEFCVGESGNLLELPEAEARAIVGDAVYESCKRWKETGQQAGTVTITGINESTGVITFDVPGLNGGNDGNP